MRIMMVVLVAALAATACESRYDWSKPERSAREWASHVSQEATVSCVRQDSDYDGYVSCTVFAKNDGVVTTHAIECAAFVDWEGCRTPKPARPVVRQ